jgi:hypothetical protein
MSRQLSFDEESLIALFFERIRRLVNNRNASRSLLMLVESQHKND